MTEKDITSEDSFVDLYTSTPPPPDISEGAPPSYSNETNVPDLNRTGTPDPTKKAKAGSSKTSVLSSGKSGTVTLPNVAKAPPPVPLTQTSRSAKRLSATTTPIADRFGTSFRPPPPPPALSASRQPEESPFGDENQVRGKTPQPGDTVMSEVSNASITMPQPQPSPGPNVVQQAGGNISQPNQSVQGTRDLTPNVSAPVATGAFHAPRGMYNPAATGATTSRKPPSRSTSLNTTLNMPSPNSAGTALPSGQSFTAQPGALNASAPRPTSLPRSGPHSNHGHASAPQPVYPQPYTPAHNFHQSQPLQPPQTTVYSNPVPSPQYSQPQMHPEVHMELQQQRRVINFYNRDDPYYEFTNFSADRVVYNGRDYPTSEHAFQAQKFLDHRPGLAEHIRTLSDNPRDAFNEARRFQPEWRPDWHSVKIQKMEEILYEKFARQPRLRRMLTETDDAELIEDSPHDPFWGIGRDRKGENQLGIALMKLRTKLQTEDLARAKRAHGQMHPVNQQYYGQSATNFGQQPINMQQQNYAQQQVPMDVQSMTPYSNQMIQQTPSSYPVPLQYSAQAQGMGTPNPGDGMYGLSS
ncbi:hypothetical protein FS842_005127 [Serendipita sp. 407]|nr:hypothetical protein FS842_005127 [Serendipita sp. 407]